MSVAGIQRGLQRALMRASLADDRELAGRVRDEGLRLVILLNGLVRTSRLYGPDNDAFAAPAAELSSALGRLMDLLGAVHFVLVEDQAYINDVRLRARPVEQEALGHLIAELERHEVGGLSFYAAPDPAAVRALARAVSEAPDDSAAPRAALAARLAAHESAVELTGRYRFRLKGERSPVPRDQVEVMRRGAQVVAEAFANLAAGRLPNPLPVRRVVIELVDGLREDPGAAAAASLRRRRHGVGEHHVLAVTSLAIQVGQALGLSDAALSDLGVAAMLHDVGYTRSEARGSHSAAGLRLLLRQRGFHEGKIRRLRAVYEHHDGPDRAPGLFARILHVADDYDVLTAARPGQPQLPPATAQASMWAARGTLYDPDVLAVFVRIMGLYPPGSLLELTDGRWAVGVSGGRDAERFAWPVVRVVRDAEGRPRDGRESLDLYESRASLRPRRIVNPASHGLDVSETLELVFGADRTPGSASAG